MATIDIEAAGEDKRHTSDGEQSTGLNAFGLPAQVRQPEQRQPCRPERQASEHVGKPVSTEVKARECDQKYQGCGAECDREAPCGADLTRDEEGEEPVEHHIDRAMAAGEGKSAPPGVEQLTGSSAMERHFDRGVERR